MNSKSEIEKLTNAEKIYVALRLLIFPLVVLLPFVLLKNRYVACVTPGDPAIPCQGTYPPSIGLTILVWLLILGALIFSFWQSSVHEQFRVRRFAYLQLGISVVVVALTIMAYAGMRSHSQASEAYVFYADKSGFTPSFNATFGIGIGPWAVAALAILYLALPFARLYTVMFGRKNIRGIPKEELFK